MSERSASSDQQPGPIQDRTIENDQLLCLPLGTYGKGYLFESENQKRRIERRNTWAVFVAVFGIAGGCVVAAKYAMAPAYALIASTAAGYLMLVGYRRFQARGLAPYPARLTTRDAENIVVKRSGSTGFAFLTVFFGVNFVSTALRLLAAPTASDLTFTLLFGAAAAKSGQLFFRKMRERSLLPPS